MQIEFEVNSNTLQFKQAFDLGTRHEEGYAAKIPVATNVLKRSLIGQFVKFFFPIGQSNALKQL